jgi:hypothetical protein
MSIIKPAVITAWADAGDKVKPADAEIAIGWPVTDIPPSRQRFNWILNYLANGVRYFSRRGLPDYDPLETYMTGDCIIGDDGNTYKSLVDNNTSNAPSVSTTKWTLWALTKTQIAKMITDAEGADLSVVAKSGKYSDLLGIPAALAIPTKLSELTNDSNFSSTNWAVKQIGTNLMFSYNGANKAYIDTAGNMHLTGDVFINQSF